MESSIAPLIDKKALQPQVAREVWKQELADAVRDPSELCDLLNLDSVVAEKAKSESRLSISCAKRFYFTHATGRLE